VKSTDHPGRPSRRRRGFLASNGRETGLAWLGRRRQVWCKISGIATEAVWKNDGTRKAFVRWIPRLMPQKLFRRGSPDFFGLRGLDGLPCWAEVPGAIKPTALDGECFGGDFGSALTRDKGRLGQWPRGPIAWQIMKAGGGHFWGDGGGAPSGCCGFVQSINHALLLIVSR